jgi:uncharacterized RDD family membrane protein YckC
MTNEISNDYKLATPGHRIGALAIDAGLNFVTLGIGWFIWSLIMWGKGQTPGKNLLKIRVINEVNGQPAHWGHMCLRQVLIPSAISISWYVPYLVFLFSGAAFGFNIFMIVSFGLATILGVAIYVTDFVWLFGPKHKRLIDYWAKTIVVNEA